MKPPGTTLSRRRSQTHRLLVGLGLFCILIGIVLFVTHKINTPAIITDWARELNPVTTPAYQSKLHGESLYVDPANYIALEQARATDPTTQAALGKITQQPIAEWFGDWNKDTQAEVHTYVSSAAAAGKLPVMVTYNIPGRDCGSYSAGGATNGQAYRAWIRQVTLGISDKPAVVVVEPDASSQTTCLSHAQQQERLQLLNYAVTELKKLPQTKVYLDAGNAGWIDPSTIAVSLEAAGVYVADGLSINVANYYTDTESIAYANKLLAALHKSDLSYIIDTSRNGAGSSGQWCNPNGRLLGRTPEIISGHDRLDAYLWIKKPGMSDGTCNGGPAAGQWWLTQALDLAR